MDIYSRSALRHRDSPLLPWHEGIRSACPSGNMNESERSWQRALETLAEGTTLVFLWRRERWSVKATLSLTCAGVKVRGFSPEGKGFLHRRAPPPLPPHP